jgi:hypothetical protein
VARQVNTTGAIVVAAMLCVSFYTFVRQATDLTTIGGFTLHITDLLFGLAISCSLFGLKNWRDHSASERMLLFLSGLLLLSFCRGLVQAGNSAAGNAFRLYSVFTALIIFTYLWGRKLDPRWVFDKIIWLGWAIVLLGITRRILGLDAFIEDADPFEEARIIDASAALMLGQAAVIALHASLVGPRVGRGGKAFAFIIFFMAVLYSDQRTATFATIAGVIVILGFVPRRRDTTIFCLGMIVCAAGIGILAVASLSDGQLTGYLPHSLQMIVLEEGTFGWRLDQWQTYYQQWVDATAFDQIAGQPLGVSLAIGLGFSTLTELDRLAIPPHSEYLGLLLNAGAVGLLIFLLAPAFAFVDAIRISNNHQSRPPLVILAIAILVSQIVFSFSYSLDNEQGFLLAISVQIIAVVRGASRRVRVVRSRPAPMSVPIYPDGRQIFMRRT